MLGSSRRVVLQAAFLSAATAGFSVLQKPSFGVAGDTASNTATTSAGAGNAGLVRLDSRGVPLPIPIPAPESSWPGTVVCGDKLGLCAGFWDPSPYSAQGFLWQAGRLQVLPEGSQPAAMNNSGVVVGDIVGRYGRQAFRWIRGQWQPLGFLGGTDDLGGRISSATAVNTAGAVAGTSTNNSGQFRAFKLVGTTMTELPTLGGASSAIAINDSGQVVGTSQRPDGTAHAVLWDDNRVYDLGTLGGSESYAVGINNAGVVVGNSLNAHGQLRAFSWEQGQITDLGCLTGDATSEALGVNRWGDVLVRSSGSNNRGFVSSRGTRTTFNSDTAIFDPADINDSGMVAGVMTNDTGQHACSWQSGAFVGRPTLGGPFCLLSQATIQGSLLGSAATTNLIPQAVVWPALPVHR